MLRGLEHLIDPPEHGERQDHVLVLAALMVREFSVPNWDGYGAEPVHPLSVQWAEQLLDALPALALMPELASDPDGDVLLEWFSDRGGMLTVSVGRAGEVRFAVRAPGAKFTGIETFEDELPAGLAHAFATLAG